MSNFSAVYSQMFADRFDVDYQASGLLRNSVQVLTGLVGASWKAKVIEKVSMYPHGQYNSNIPAIVPTTSAPTLNFEDWNLKLVLDLFESKNINANIITSYSELHAKAIGVQEDAAVIDALNNSGTTKVVDDDYGSVGTTSNLPLEKLIQAAQLLGQDEIQYNNQKLYFVCHRSQLGSLLNQKEAQNWNYNSVRALVNGDINTFMGFTWIVLGDRYDNNGVNIGLPKTGNIRTCFAFAQSSTYLGYRLSPSVKMVEVPQEARIETLSTASFGAVTARPKGVVMIECDETK